MPTVRKIAEDIVLREGGFVDDPDDPGGATNHGVTIHTMRRLKLDLDGDGDIDSEDVKALSAAQAADIYLKHYYYGTRLHWLPEPVQASVFDMYVNAGANAVKILQRLLSTMGYPLAADGHIGPKTAEAAEAAHFAAPDYLADAYGIERRNYYYALADRRPASRKYARRRDGGKGGWIVRAEEFVSPKYHLSQQEHAERVASWA
ncbi:MAG: holin-associated N-acetylmuramidase [Pseudomonadota bacterium]